MKYIGIDLGTTYCCISGMDDTSDELVVFKNHNNESMTPSVVRYITRENHIVGEQAKAEMALYNKDDVCWVVSQTKRHMNDSKFSIKIGEKDNSFVVTPQDVATDILHYLINLPEVKKFIGKDEYRCVITHPDTYSQITTQKVQIAAENAKIKNVDFISEPTAAAISYCIDKKFENGNLLVFDLGGGTLDLTLVRVKGRNYRTIDHEGLETCGGVDWDKEIQNEIIHQYAKFKGIQEEDILRSDNSDYSALRHKIETYSEEIKKTICTYGSFEDILQNIDSEFEFELDEETFEELTEPLILQAVGTIKTLMERNNGVKIDHIVLVGGSSRMTQVRENVIDEVEDCIPEFNGSISQFDPSFAISKGAVYAAKYDPRNGVVTGTGIAITELMPQTVGVGVYDPPLNRNVCSNILFKDDAIPCHRDMTYYTRFDNQTSLSFDLYTNETRKASPKDVSEIFECKNIGYFELKLPRGVKAQTPVYVSVDVDRNGLIFYKFQCSGVEGNTTAQFKD